MSIALLNVPKASSTPRIDSPIAPQGSARGDFQQVLQTARRTKPMLDRPGASPVQPPTAEKAPPSEPPSPEPTEASNEAPIDDLAPVAANPDEQASPPPAPTAQEDASQELPLCVADDPLAVPAPADSAVAEQSDQDAQAIVPVAEELKPVPMPPREEPNGDSPPLGETAAPIVAAVAPDSPGDVEAEPQASTASPAHVQPETQRPTPQQAHAEPKPPQPPPARSSAAAPVLAPEQASNGSSQGTDQGGREAPRQSMGQALELADSRRPDTALTPVAAAPALEKAATPAPASPTVVVEAPASSVPQAVARPAALEPTAPLPQPPVASEARFAQSNHAGIVTSIRGQLLPNGGTMQIRLDPPELGVLQVMVRVNDGMISASFQTSNDQATRLLSHSLAQLKSALQTTGVGVERLSVQQSKPDEQAAQQDPRQGAWDDQHNARQEQHRREALRRMWRRLGVEDPLDMVA